MVAEARNRSVTLQGDHPLVVGLGNPLAGDDSIGLQLIRRLRFLYPEYKFLELPQAGPHLFDLLDSAAPILFIDAISSGSAPGTVRLIPLPSSSLESRALSSVSSHGWNLTEAIDLRRSLGHVLPPLALLGIELGDATPGSELSPEVQHAMNLVVMEFPGFLHRAFGLAAVAPLRVA